MSAKKRKFNKQLPIMIEKDLDGFFVIECPLFSGCYSQGQTLDEAISNIKEVIDLCLEDKRNREVLKEYRPEQISFHVLPV